MVLPLLAAGAAAAAPWALRAAPLVLGLAPVIKDAMKTPGAPDPKVLADIAARRDALAERLAGAEGIPLEQAKQAINEQLKPLIDKATAAAPPEDTTMDKVIDAGGLVGDVLVGGMLLKGAGQVAGKLTGKAAGDAAKAAATEAAATAKSGEAAIDAGNFKGPARMAAERGAMDRVEPQEPTRFGGHLPAPEGMMERQGALVPPDGGVDPMDDRMTELRALLLAARKRGMAPPPAFRAPPLGIGMTPETGRRLDVAGMRSRMYGGEGD